jgi:hypothetical protein
VIPGETKRGRKVGGGDLTEFLECAVGTVVIGEDQLIVVTIRQRSDGGDGPAPPTLACSL